MKCVEFVGLPGSGKTTLAGLTAAALRGQGLRVAEPTSALHTLARPRRAPVKLWLALRASAHSPGVPARLLRAVLGSQQRAASAAGTNLLNLLFQRALAERADPTAELLVFDQGALQALWSLNLEARRQTLDPELYGLVAGPNPERLAVFVDAGADSAFHRLVERGNGSARVLRARDSSGTGALNPAELLERTWELANALARRHPGFVPVRVSNPDGHAARASAEVVTAALRYLNPP